MTLRNRAYEDQFFRHLESECRRRFGEDVGACCRRVRERLEMGRKRYGDNAFMYKNMYHEALEESPDFIAYILLELHKLGADSTEAPPEQHYHLWEACLYAALADWHVRRAAMLARTG